jgi:uncharacterized membrane protein YhaH (DUF805 family)
MGEIRPTVRLTGAGALATQAFMNDLSQDAWFYAHNGEKGGPVGFSDLQGMAKEGKLHPRLDLIWAKGMDRWQPAGEIQGLFERQPPVVAPVAAEQKVVPQKTATAVPPAKAAAEPYVAPEEDFNDPASGEVAMPGARRRSYLFFLIVFPVLWLALTVAVATSMNGKVGQETLALVVSGMLVLPGLVGLVISILRLVNVGMSGWWLLGNLVPVLNLWVGYRCFACPSGYAIHKKMDAAGIILAILYWLMMLAGIVALVSLVAIIFGHMGPPELREQIVDTIRESLNMPAEP